MLTENQKRLCMTPKDVAFETGYSMPTVYELVNREDFPSIRFGKRIIIPREAFEQWLMDTVSGGRAVIDKQRAAR